MHGHADSTHMDRDLGTRDTDMYVMDLGEQAHTHGHMNMWTHRHMYTRTHTQVHTVTHRHMHMGAQTHTHEDESYTCRHTRTDVHTLMHT